MKLIKSFITICNQQFYLVQIEKDDIQQNAPVPDNLKTMFVDAYATIPTNLIDSRGYLTRVLSLNDLQPGSTIEVAIENRKDLLMIEELTKGIDDLAQEMKIVSDYYKNKNKESSIC